MGCKKLFHFDVEISL